MKLFALAAAGLIAIGTFAAAPAEAQRYGYGYQDRGYDRGWDDRGRSWNRGRGWDRGPRGWRGRDRVRCRWVRGWDGPVRRCWR